MKRAPLIWLGLIVVVIGIYIGLSMTSRNSSDTKINSNLTATLETSIGNIVVQFYPAEAPKTVSNFIKLSQDGFYDGLTFHRVIPGFMIQGGDPYCGRDESSRYKDADDNPVQICGTGGPGYSFADEINPASPVYRAGYNKGILAMANSGPDTNGSQFFIMVMSTNLPPNYTIFGKVIEGQEIADRVSLVSRDSKDRPVEPVFIKRIVVSQ